MTYLLDIPTRIVIGSTLGIVFLGAIAGTIGKMATGQIVWPAAVALVAGTVPGARFGGVTVRLEAARGSAPARPTSWSDRG